MAEPIGIAAGILALTSFAFTSSISLYQTVESFRANQKNIREIKEELEALNRILEDLQVAAAKDSTHLERLNVPLLRCGKACSEFEAVIIKCTAHYKGSRTSFRDWLSLQYMGGDIAGFKNMLAGYKSTISIALGVANFRQASAAVTKLGGFDEKLTNTTSQLEEHLRQIDGRLQTLSRQENKLSNEYVVEQVRAEEEKDSIKECLAICTQASDQVMRIASGVREVSKELQRIPIKVAVRKVMIVTQGHDDHLVDLIRELAEWLMITPRYGNDLGVHVYVDAQLRESERFNASALLERDSRLQHMLKYWTPEFCRTSPAELDLVISLGGDETVLFTSWLFQTVVPPIMSLALSSLGFLTYFGFEFYKQHLDGIMGEQGMRVYLRMRYTCTISRGQRREEAGLRTPRKEEQFEVLNELMVMSYCGPAPYVSNLALYADDELLTDIQAEGCVFSTETGSIAHALSSGVSLIHPSIPAILLTPICPHTLAFRPMIFSDTLLLRVAVLHDSTSTAHCSFDGRGRIELYQGDSITINASQYPFPTVMRSTTEDWFQNVTKALKWNTRSVMQKRWSEVEERRDVTAIEDIEEAEDKKIDLTPDCLVHSRSSSPLQDSRLMMAPMNLQDRSEGFA